MGAVKKVASTALKGVGGFLTGGPVGAAVGIGSALLGAKNAKGALDPKVLNQPQNLANNTFANALNEALKGKGNISEILAKATALPAYTGQMSAGLNEAQTSAIQGIQDLFTSQSGSAFGLMNPLLNMANAGGSLQLPPELAAVLGNIGGQGTLASYADGSNPLMGGALDLMGGNMGTNAAMSRLLRMRDPSGGAQNLLGSIMGGADNPAITALLGIGGGGAGAEGTINNLLASYSNPAIAGLLGSSGYQSPEQNLLTALAASGDNPYIAALAGTGGGAGRSAERALTELMQVGTMDDGTAIMGQLFDSPLVQELTNSTASGQFQSIADAMDAARRRSLDKDLVNLREQFSFQGLGRGTSLQRAAGNLMEGSQVGMQAELARVAPQIFGQAGQLQLGTLGALGDLAGSMSSLGTGRLSALGQLASAAGGLSQGRAGIQQAGLQGAAGAQNSQLGTIGQILANAGQLGTAGQGLNLQALSNAGNLNVSQLQALISGAGTAGQLGLGGESNIIDALKSSGMLNNDQLQALMGGATSMGNLANAGQSNVIQALMGGGNLGSATNAQDADILSRLMQLQTGAAGTLGQQSVDVGQILATMFGQQGNQSLQAALALPGANATTADLLSRLAQGSLAAGGVQQTAEQQALDRAYQEFVRQQSGAGSILSYLSGTPQAAYAPSTASSLAGLLGTGAGIYGTIKGAK